MDDMELYDGITKRVNIIIRLAWTGIVIGFLMGVVARSLFDLIT
jgi:hypothetical protein